MYMLFILGLTIGVENIISYESLEGNDYKRICK